MTVQVRLLYGGGTFGMSVIMRTSSSALLARRLSRLSLRAILCLELERELHVTRAGDDLRAVNTWVRRLYDTVRWWPVSVRLSVFCTLCYD